MRTVKLVAFLLTALAVLPLAGCWGSRETDEVAYVLAIGFDKGEKDELVVTASIANPKIIAGAAGGGGGGGGDKDGKGTLVVSVETYAPLAAFDLLNTSVDRWLSLQHTIIYIFSEEMAKEGLGKWVNPLLRYRELRSTSAIIICRGKARDLIEKNKPLLEITPTKQIEMVVKLSREIGLYPHTTFRDFYSDSKSLSTEPVIPLIAIHEGGLETARPGVKLGGDFALGKYVAGETPITGGNKAQVIGSAVFRADKMVGTINGHETRFYLMLRGLFKNGIMSIMDPLADEDIPVSVVMHQARSPKYKTSIDEAGNVTIDVEIFLEPEIVGILSGINYEDTENKQVLEQAFSSHVEQGCQTLIKRTQEEFKADIVGFGYWVKHHFRTVPPWQEFAWLQRYPDAQVNVTVHTRIRRTGLTLKTTPTTRGEVQ